MSLDKRWYVFVKQYFFMLGLYLILTEKLLDIFNHYGNIYAIIIVMAFSMLITITITERFFNIKIWGGL